MTYGGLECAMQLVLMQAQVVRWAEPDSAMSLISAHRNTCARSLIFKDGYLRQLGDWHCFWLKIVGQVPIA